MFILKGVKVLCFDTLLQVFILKGLTGAAVLPSLDRKSRSLAMLGMTILGLSFDGEEATRQSAGGAGSARGLRRTGWGANFMSQDSAKRVCCQEQYVGGELAVRTEWEVVERARVTACNVTKGGRHRISLPLQKQNRRR